MRGCLCFISAAGGKIVLAAGDTFSRAIEGLDSLSVAVDGGTGRAGQFGTLSANVVEGDGGSITMTAGDVVALSSDSLTTANAGTNGGEVVIWSEGITRFYGTIEARGGSEPAVLPLHYSPIIFFGLAFSLQNLLFLPYKAFFSMY